MVGLAHEPIALRIPIAALLIPRSIDQGSMSRLLELSGVELLDEKVLGVLPNAAHGAIFDMAVRLGTALVRRALKSGQSASAVVFPAKVSIAEGQVRLIDDQLLRDLKRRSLQLGEAGVYATGYVSRWLDGTYEFESGEELKGPFGRAIPLRRVAKEKTPRIPWHNPTPLGRNVRVDRSVLDSDHASQPGLVVTGGLGLGKSYAAWQSFTGAAEAPVWVDLGRSLSGSPSAARGLATELMSRGYGGQCPMDRKTIRNLPSMSPEECVDQLAGWLRSIRAQGGELPGVVFDNSEWAVESDRELVEILLARAEDIPGFRHLVLGREGGASFDLPTVRLSRWNDADLEEFQGQLLEGLGVPRDVAAAWMAEAAGLPLALEEILFESIRRGELRRVYGSFFYAGENRERGRPSTRLVATVEAEMLRLGGAFPLRALAIAGGGASAEVLLDVSSRYGVELEADWWQPFVGGGLLEMDAEERFSFACPAIAAAVAATVEDPEALRHEAGMAVVQAESGWQQQWDAYQLLRVSDETVPVLIELTRKRHPPTRDPELFAAMVTSFRSLRSRVGSDQAAESLARELLWAMLPVARRTGHLSDVEDELAELIKAETGPRQTALILLKSDLDVEQGRFDQAEEGLFDALGHSAGGNLDTRARLLIGIAKLAKQRGRYRKSRRVLSDLLEVLEPSQTALRASSLFHLAEVDLAECEVEDAARRHAEARELRLGDPAAGRSLVRSMTALGNVALITGDYPESLIWFRRAVAAARDLEAEAELAESLRGEGRVLGRLGDHQTATRSLREASTILATRDDRTSFAITALDLAQNRARLGSLQAAISDARKAHFELSLMPEGEWRGHSFQLLGRLLLLHEELAEARECFFQAADIHERFGAWPEVALDRSLIVDVARTTEDESGVLCMSRSLLDQVADLRVIPHGELIFYRIFRAFEWLQGRGEAVPSPSKFLERAYAELLRKTAFLDPDYRHVFLSHIAEHQAIIRAAAERQLPMPV